MKLYKLVEVDVDAERKRIRRVRYTKAERANLLKLCDLFEAGKFQECLTFIQTWERSKRDFIGFDIGKVLLEMGYEYFYTREEIIASVKEILAKEQAEKEKETSRITGLLSSERGRKKLAKELVPAINRAFFFHDVALEADPEWLKKGKWKTEKGRKWLLKTLQERQNKDKKCKSKS